MKHTDWCIQTHADYEHAIKRYDRRWPEHCTNCHASGVITWQEDPSPSGVGLSPGTMTFADPCPDCLEKGACPRCGNNNGHGWCIGEMEPCPACGWSEDDIDGHAPTEPECWCYLDERIGA